MKVYCIECNTPMDINFSEIRDTYIPPDLCHCDNCSQKKETAACFTTPKISYRELREKEQEEINQHRWFMSEKLGYDVGKDFSEADWRKNYEPDFLKQWHYR